MSADAQGNDITTRLLTRIPGRFLREVSLYVSGTGWRAYDNVIGQPLFYPGFTEQMINRVVSAPLLRARIRLLAESRVETEEKEGWLNSKSANYPLERAQRLAAIEAGLKEVAQKMTNDMICKFESKPFIRSAYYTVTQLLTRAYHQGSCHGTTTICAGGYSPFSRYSCLQRRSTSIAQSRRGS